MENVVLVIHLLLALGLIAVVLMQRSEGGGLGIGGGGGGAVSARGAATALGKVTWGLAIAFIVTSMTLTILAASSGGSSSVIDRLGGGDASSEGVDSGEGLLPPILGDDPLLPPPTE